MPSGRDASKRGTPVVGAANVPLPPRTRTTGAVGSETAAPAAAVALVGAGVGAGDGGTVHSSGLVAAPSRRRRRRRDASELTEQSSS